MPAPPGLTASASARRHHERREGRAANPCLPVEALVRVARSSPEVAALNIGQSHLSRIVRAYIRQHVPTPTTSTVDDLLDDPRARYALIEWVASYADPTAREAVRNVDRERGWR